MRAGVGVFLLVTFVAVALPSGASAQEPHPELTPFERLVGGSWHLGTESYHTFAWGVGGQSVESKSYFVLPEGEKLVSEGRFFYHPGEQAVKGYAVAIDMGLDLFEYRVEARGDTLVMDLSAFGPAADGQPLRETWVFTDDDHYVWTLFQRAGGLWQRWMGGTYERRPGN